MMGIYPLSPGEPKYAITIPMFDKITIQLDSKYYKKREIVIEKEENKLKSIILENGFEISAKLFIDASIEGHLIHFAGVTTETMREGNATYGETRNGIQVDNTYRQFMGI